MKNLTKLNIMIQFNLNKINYRASVTETGKPCPWEYKL